MARGYGNKGSSKSMPPKRGKSGVKKKTMKTMEQTPMKGPRKGRGMKKGGSQSGTKY